MEAFFKPGEEGIGCAAKRGVGEGVRVEAFNGNSGLFGDGFMMGSDEEVETSTRSETSIVSWQKSGTRAVKDGVERGKEGNGFIELFGRALEFKNDGGASGGWGSGGFCFVGAKGFGSNDAVKDEVFFSSKGVK